MYLIPAKFSLKDALVLPLAVLVPSCVLKQCAIGHEPHSKIMTAWFSGVGAAVSLSSLDICRMQEALNQSIINLSPEEKRERMPKPPNCNVNVVSVC